MSSRAGALSKISVNANIFHRLPPVRQAGIDPALASQIGESSRLTATEPRTVSSQGVRDSALPSRPLHHRSSRPLRPRLSRLSILSPSAMAVIITPQPPGCSCDNLIGWGITGSVYYDERRKEVIKAPNSLEDRILIEVEKDIYERLCEGRQHKRLLQYNSQSIDNECILYPKCFCPKRHFSFSFSEKQ